MALPVMTAKVLLSRGAYRILFAMGGVRVRDVRAVGDGLVEATLGLTPSMLLFTCRLDGVRTVVIV